LALFCENESNPPLNQALPLEKSLAFFLDYLKTHPKPNDQNLIKTFFILFVFNYMHENAFFFFHDQTYLNVK